MNEVEKFISRENITNLKKRLENPADEVQRQTLLKLLAEEIAKSRQIQEKRSGAEDK